MYVVQSRPVTSFAFPRLQWTNANFVEVFPGYFSPLSFSLAGTAFSSNLQV